MKLFTLKELLQELNSIAEEASKMIQKRLNALNDEIEEEDCVSV